MAIVVATWKAACFHVPLPSSSSSSCFSAVAAAAGGVLGRMSECILHQLSVTWTIGVENKAVLLLYIVSFTSQKTKHS